MGQAESDTRIEWGVGGLLDFNVGDVRAVVDERARLSDRCLLSASTGSTCAAASGRSVRQPPGGRDAQTLNKVHPAFV